MISGSSNGISDNFVVEIKCPTKAHTYKIYKNENKPTILLCTIAIANVSV